MKKMICRLHNWLIALLIGPEKTVIFNARFQGGIIWVSPDAMCQNDTFIYPMDIRLVNDQFTQAPRHSSD